MFVWCYSDCAEKTPCSKAVWDDAGAKILWDESVRLVRLSDDEICPLIRPTTI